MILYAMLVLTLCLWSRIVLRILMNTASRVAFLGAFLIIATAGSFLSCQLFQQVKDLNALPHQLEILTVRQAQCSCCSTNHVSSETGMAINCDRSLVHKKLTERYLNKLGDLSDNAMGGVPDDSSCHGIQLEESDNPQSNRESGSLCMHKLSQKPVLQVAALDEFDVSVHTEVASYILRGLSHNGLRYHHILVAETPILWFISDIISAARNLENADIFSWILVGQGVDFLLVLPAFFGLFYKGLQIMERHTRKGSRSRGLIAAFHLIVPAVTLSLTWVVGKVLNGMVEQRLPFIIFTAGLCLFNFGVSYNMNCRIRLRP